MNGSMVWLRRQEVVSPKYHRVLQTQADPSFLLTEGTDKSRTILGKEVEKYTHIDSSGRGCAGGSAESRRDTRQERMHRGERTTQICRRKEEGRELDVEEASDKPRRDVMTEKGSLRNGINFPGDIMAWHGGGQSAKIECL
jgi:hypothetical protein